MVTMALAADPASVSQPPQVLLSHVEMYQRPHDFQIIAQGFIVSSSVVPLPLDYPPNPTGWHTISPDTFSLNDFIAGRISQFNAGLYNGSDEHNGILTTNVTISFGVTKYFNELYSNKTQGYEGLVYRSFSQISLINSSSTTRSAELSKMSLFLSHSITVAPDFDHLVRVVIDPSQCSSATLHVGDVDNVQWLIFGRSNIVSDRLQPGDSVSALLLGDPWRQVCTLSVQEQLSCLLGDDFYTLCDSN